MKILGPFSQIITLQNLPLQGPLKDPALHVLLQGAVLISQGKILAVGVWKDVVRQYPNTVLEMISEEMVLLPGFVDCHTHICFGGSRCHDYSLRTAGKTYLEIAKAGGGIWSTVQATRAATEQDLLASTLQRINRHAREGVTTIEIKSGYGLALDAELKMLQTIRAAATSTQATLVSTCLAAHILPKDFLGGEATYLEWILEDLLPILTAEKLSKRVDIFVEESAFSSHLAIPFLKKVTTLGFDIVVHADQFTAGSSLVAVQCQAVSADHLEASTEREINAIAKSKTVATVLPGASLGLGMHFAPARKLLDAGCCLAIASDWNPGSAPQGDLLMQGAVLGAFEKLTAAEVFAGLTYRAAHALKMYDRGVLASNFKADLQAYPTNDYREILYHQGKLKPAKVWIGGQLQP